MTSETFVDDALFAEISNFEDLDEMTSHVYTELKRIARHHLRRERPGHTLQPTELVHEIYLILRADDKLEVDDRLRFLALSSVVMRRFLVNYAVHKKRKKRSGEFPDITFDENENLTFVTFERKSVDLLALESALNLLAKQDARKVRIVELKFFGGLTFAEIAEHLSLSMRTVLRDWKLAKLWLYRELKNKRKDK
ncbi:MAG: hypothetical protein KIS76_03220 [Pyrinomonadaceae bacterium]|nr:hypothetical protein [Pyrinomonadaceae bacterium]